MVVERQENGFNIVETLQEGRTVRDQLMFDYPNADKRTGFLKLLKTKQSTPDIPTSPLKFDEVTDLIVSQDSKHLVAIGHEDSRKYLMRDDKVVLSGEFMGMTIVGGENSVRAHQELNSFFVITDESTVASTLHHVLNGEATPLTDGHNSLRVFATLNEWESEGQIQVLRSTSTSGKETIHFVDMLGKIRTPVILRDDVEYVGLREVDVPEGKEPVDMCVVLTSRNDNMDETFVTVVKRNGDVIRDIEVATDKGSIDIERVALSEKGINVLWSNETDGKRTIYRNDEVMGAEIEHDDIVKASEDLSRVAIVTESESGGVGLIIDGEALFVDSRFSLYGDLFDTGVYLSKELDKGLIELQKNEDDTLWVYAYTPEGHGLIGPYENVTILSSDVSGEEISFLAEKEDGKEWKIALKPEGKLFQQVSPEPQSSESLAAE